MARKKTDADRLYNIKRRLLRAAKRAEASGDKGLSDYLRAESKAYIKGRKKSEIKSQSQVSKLIKSGTKFIKQTFKGLSKSPVTKTQRRNAIFKQQHKGERSVNKTLFWKATTQIWVGQENDRYKAVLDYFYNSKTPDAVEFQVWLKDNELPNSRDLFNVQRFIEEKNKAALERAEVEGMQADGSPKAFTKLVTFG